MAEISNIESARFWIASAHATLKISVYTTAMYSAEMAAEIALKGVLVALGMDIPKAHDIVPLMKASFEEKRTLLPKEFLEKERFMFTTLKMLVDLRPLVGYAHEGNIDEKKIRTEAPEYVKKAEEIVELCGKAIAHINKKK